jgi:hypothetical protein
VAFRGRIPEGTFDLAAKGPGKEGNLVLAEEAGEKRVTDPKLLALDDGGGVGLPGDLRGVGDGEAYPLGLDASEPVRFEVVDLELLGGELALLLGGELGDEAILELVVREGKVAAEKEDQGVEGSVADVRGGCA